MTPTEEKTLSEKVIMENPIAWAVKERDKFWMKLVKKLKGKVLSSDWALSIDEIDKIFGRFNSPQTKTEYDGTQLNRLAQNKTEDNHAQDGLVLSDEQFAKEVAYAKKDKKGCGKWVQKKTKNGLLQYICGDTYKGFTPLCPECDQVGLREVGK